MKATNIQWETDSENIKLPTEIIIPKEIENDIDAISDYLSNTTGFCHLGFELDTEKKD